MMLGESLVRILVLVALGESLVRFLVLACVEHVVSRSSA